MDWAKAVRDNPAIQMDAKSKMSRGDFTSLMLMYNFDENIS